MSAVVHAGDSRQVLASLSEASVDCCITSPPYYGLRDYGVQGQIGLEETPFAYVAELVAVFEQVKRVLKPQGTLWLNLGDSYAGSWGNYGAQNRGNGKQRAITVGSSAMPRAYKGKEGWRPPTSHKLNGLKPKDLIGIPWRVAFALQEAGWWLRSDIIWAKANPMPESITDRPTKAHEYIFLMAKSERYYYNAQAIAETASDGGQRNARTVWTQVTEPFAGAHFATMPLSLARKMVLAGCPVGGVVLDPFSGAATTGVASLQTGRQYIGIELNPEYAQISKERLTPFLIQPMLGVRHG